jgi:ABC-type transporter MlaC component
MMIRKLLMVASAAGLVAIGLACEQAKSTVSNTATKVADKAKETAAAGKEGLARMAKSKETFLKPIEEMLPKVDEKIKALTGDGKTKAADSLAAVKKLIDEFKAAPTDKFEGLMKGITEKVAELKKMVGL